jgi:hypothetical protein
VKKLRAILQPLKGRGVCLRIEPKNKLFLSGAVSSMSESEKDSIKANKCFIANILPVSRNYTIAQILEALERMLNHSDGLVVDAGYDVHGADLRALPIGRYYLETVDTH